MKSKKGIITLKDCIIEDIKTHDYKYPGCETCDYGAIHEREVKFYFDDDDYITINAQASLEYHMTLADIMYVTLNNYDKIVLMNKEQFCEFIYKALVKKVSYSSSECKLDYFTNIKFSKEIEESMDEFNAKSPFDFEV